MVHGVLMGRFGWQVSLEQPFIFFLNYMHHFWCVCNACDIYHMSLSSDSSDSSLRLLTFSHFEAKWLLPLHLARMALHMGPLPFFFSFLADFRFFLDLSKGLFCRCYLSFAPCASSLCDAEKVLNYEFAASVLLPISMHLFRSSVISWSIRFGCL